MKRKLLHSKTRNSSDSKYKIFAKWRREICAHQNREINMESRKFGACLFEVVSLRIDPHKPHFLFFISPLAFNFNGHGLKKLIFYLKRI